MVAVRDLMAAWGGEQMLVVVPAPAGFDDFGFFSVQISRCGGGGLTGLSFIRAYRVKFFVDSV